MRPTRRPGGDNSMPRGRMIFSVLILSGLLAGGLAACGIRGELEPPRGAEDEPEPDQVTSY